MAGRIPTLHLFPSSSQPSHRTLGTPPPSPPQQILYTEQKIDTHTKKRVPATRHNMLLTFNMQTTCRTHTLTQSIQQYNATLRPLPVHPHLYLHWRTCYHYHLVKGLHSCFAPIERGFLGASRSKWYNIRNMPTVLFEGHSWRTNKLRENYATAASAIIHVTSPRRTSSA